MTAHLKHPDVHAPWSQWSEEQTLWLVLPYSNPFRWQTRRTHFNDAIRHFKSLPNIMPIVVELAYGNRPFEVTQPNDPLHVQLRTESAAWHKENLVNIGVSRIPDPNWLYAGYADGDFHTTRYDLGLEAIHMLQHYHFVQLFSAYADLTAETPTSHLGHRPYRINSSFAWNYLHQSAFKQAKQKPLSTDPYRGLLMMLASDQFPFGFAPGAPGGMWAWNREAFNHVGGLLDTCLLGSGDWHMGFGLIGAPSSRLETLHMGRAYNKAITDWQARARMLDIHHGKGTVGCVDAFATHFFHGSHKSRAYGDRWQILVRHDFDPGSDIQRDWQGVWRWTGSKPRLRDEVTEYFVNRMEDDPAWSEIKPIV